MIGKNNENTLRPKNMENKGVTVQMCWSVCVRINKAYV